MKRILLVNILLLVTLICFADEKADLKMQKGLKKVYVTETIIDAPYPPSASAAAAAGIIHALRRFLGAYSPASFTMESSIA